MRLNEPRIPPLPIEDWSDGLKKRMGVLETSNTKFSLNAGGGSLFNVIGTLAQHPKLSKALSHFSNHIMGSSTLAPREREMLILRIGFLCKAEYEWAQHKLFGKSAGLTDDEILRITKGPGAEGWDQFDAALLRAADELYNDSFISDETWDLLSNRYNQHQMMDVVFTVGQYNLISMALNTFGVQLDDGLTGFPE